MVVRPLLRIGENWRVVEAADLEVLRLSLSMTAAELGARRGMISHMTASYHCTLDAFVRNNMLWHCWWCWLLLWLRVGVLLRRSCIYTSS